MAYITYINRQIKEIACKGCRKMIAARRGPAQNFRLDLTDDYSVMTLEMRNPDGQLSRHQTPMCEKCHMTLMIESMSSPEPLPRLQQLYDEDMEQHYTTTVRMGYPAAEVQTMVNRFARRIPLRVLG